MIGKIKGTLVEVDGNLGLIETTGGVFYNVFLTPNTISRFPTPSTNFQIYTYLHVREDALILFGFEKKDEYQLFKMLLDVSGVGPKTAFNIISFISPKNLITAIENNDVDALTQVPGLGKKTAMKIILELSSKLKTDFQMKNIVLSEDDKMFIDAMVSLGYSATEAKKQLLKIPKNLSLEEKIKLALKNYEK
ncbi:MAG: Holliday junction branch migration protein RuvA [Microgenomates group bacterium]